MKVTIENNELVIRAPIDGKTPSKSGKSFNVATSHGNIPTAAIFNGRPVIVGLNAYIKSR